MVRAPCANPVGFLCLYIRQRKERLTLCNRYDIEIGAIEVQASKLQQQLEMASHAIALLTAARDRETEE